MLKEVLVLGIGGDGVQLLSNFLSDSLSECGYAVSNFYIYGSQVRGGESTVVVKFSDNEIINPIYSSPDYVVVLNDSYYDKYKEEILKDTKIIKLTEAVKNKNIILLSKLVKEISNDNGIENNLNEKIFLYIEKKFKDKAENIKQIYMKEWV